MGRAGFCFTNCTWGKDAPPLTKWLVSNVAENDTVEVASTAPTGPLSSNGTLFSNKPSEAPAVSGAKNASIASNDVIDVALAVPTTSPSISSAPVVGIPQNNTTPSNEWDKAPVDPGASDESNSSGTAHSSVSVFVLCCVGVSFSKASIK